MGWLFMSGIMCLVWFIEVRFKLLTVFSGFGVGGWVWDFWVYG